MCAMTVSVPSERTLIDVIAALPEDELRRLRQKNQRDLVRARAEVARLEVQEQQFEMAIAKRERKKPGRPGVLTPELVLDATRRTDSPMTASEVRDTLISEGLTVNVNAVRNHLNKLVKDGDLEKDEDGRFLEAPADDDIPS